MVAWPGWMVIHYCNAGSWEHWDGGGQITSSVLSTLSVNCLRDMQMDASEWQSTCTIWSSRERPEYSRYPFLLVCLINYCCKEDTGSVFQLPRKVIIKLTNLILLNFHSCQSDSRLLHPWFIQRPDRFLLTFEWNYFLILISSGLLISQICLTFPPICYRNSVPICTEFQMYAKPHARCTSLAIVNIPRDWSLKRKQPNNGKKLPYIKWIIASLFLYCHVLNIYHCGLRNRISYNKFASGQGFLFRQ